MKHYERGMELLATCPRCEKWLPNRPPPLLVEVRNTRTGEEA